MLFRSLSLEMLTEWLAKRVGMDYLHIDPLKIDFTGVTEIMSSAYATRLPQARQRTARPGPSSAFSPSVIAAPLQCGQVSMHGSISLSAFREAGIVLIRCNKRSLGTHRSRP